MAKEKVGSIASRAEALLRPVVEEMGFILWDVEYKKEGSEYNLILTVDKAEGEFDMDDCVALTNAVNPVLDEADPIPDSYCLEVSSAGLERELKRPEHFEKYMGQEVEVKLFAPIDKLPKLFEAKLAGYDGGSVSFEANGESVAVDGSKIAYIKNIVDYKEIFKKDK